MTLHFGMVTPVEVRASIPLACLRRLAFLLARMAFADKAPICKSGFMPMTTIGVPLSRYDLLTHHFAFCLALLQNVCITFALFKPSVERLMPPPYRPDSI